MSHVEEKPAHKPAFKWSECACVLPWQRRLLSMDTHHHEKKLDDGRENQRELTPLPMVDTQTSQAWTDKTVLQLK